MTNEIKCPKCGSTQIAANKKGFSGTKAVGGAILTGGIGLLAGTIGSNKIIITCLNCGNNFSPGQKIEKPQTVYLSTPPTKGTWISQKIFYIVTMVICFWTLIISAILEGWIVFSIVILVGITQFIGLRNVIMKLKEFDKSNISKNTASPEQVEQRKKTKKIIIKFFILPVVCIYVIIWIIMLIING